MNGSGALTTAINCYPVRALVTGAVRGATETVLSYGKPGKATVISQYLCRLLFSIAFYCYELLMQC